MKHYITLTKRFIYVGAVIVGCVGTGHAQNIIKNGDFSLGNASFSSDYPYVPYDYGSYSMTPQLADGTYTVGPFVPPSFFDWAPFHTVSGGHTQMLIANGAADGAESVWEQNVTVLPNTTYTVSFYLAEISSPVTVAEIEVEVAGGRIGVGVAPWAIDTWQKYSFTWNSGANTNVLLALKDLNTAGPNNDFAIDNICMSATPQEERNVNEGVQFLHGAERLKPGGH